MSNNYQTASSEPEVPKQVCSIVATRVFLAISLLSIAATVIHAIPVDGGGEIGIIASPLSIGDRAFYINDLDPLGKVELADGNIAASLYPILLKFYSLFVTHFGYTSISPAWNACAITVTWCASLTTLYSIRRISLIVFNDQRASEKAALLYAACPYTYYYILSGGITAIFACIYSLYILAIVRTCSLIIRSAPVGVSIWLFQVTMAAILASLRPTALPIVVVMQLGLVFHITIRARIVSIVSRKRVIKLYQASSAYCLIASLAISLYILLPNQTYIQNSLRAYEVEKGTHLGVERIYIKEIIDNLQSTGKAAEKSMGILLLASWRISDSFLGINDARATYTSLPSVSLVFGIVMRGFFAIFFFLPVSYSAIWAAYVYNIQIKTSGFWIPLLSTLCTLLYTLLGFPMSRYYIMVWTPVICLAGLFWNMIESARSDADSKLDSSYKSQLELD